MSKNEEKIYLDFPNVVYMTVETYERVCTAQWLALTIGKLLFFFIQIIKKKILLSECNQWIPINDYFLLHYR